METFINLFKQVFYVTNSPQGTEAWAPATVWWSGHRGGNPVNGVTWVRVPNLASFAECQSPPSSPLSYLILCLCQ